MVSISWKSPELDPLLLLAVAGLSLTLEASLRLAEAANQQLLALSADSKKILGSRILPEREV